MANTGYKTCFMGANDCEGVKTRRLLNAPISMDFKHTLRSYMTREKLDMRRLVRIEEDPRLNGFEIVLILWLPFHSVTRRKLVSRFEVDSMPQNLVYSLMNQNVSQLIESAKLPVKLALMREYNRQTLHCYGRNRERYLTHE